MPGKIVILPIILFLLSACDSDYKQFPWGTDKKVLAANIGKYDEELEGFHGYYTAYKTSGTFLGFDCRAYYIFSFDRYLRREFFFLKDGKETKSAVYDILVKRHGEPVGHVLDKNREYFKWAKGDTELYLEEILQRDMPFGYVSNYFHKESPSKLRVVLLPTKEIVDRIDAEWRRIRREMKRKSMNE